MISEDLRADMEQRQIDVDLSLALLERIRAGAADADPPAQARGIPGVDGSRVVDTTTTPDFTADAVSISERLDGLGLSAAAMGLEIPRTGTCVLSKEQLHVIGMHLVPKTAYGVLNGGSATSYADTTKNEGFSAELYALYTDLLGTVGEQVRGTAKGLTPALFGRDGTPGPSFLELKMRHLLLLLAECSRSHGVRIPADHVPMFQMTSVHNNEEVQRAYDAYRTSPLLADLIERTGVDITRVRTGVQPMICAFTHSNDGTPRQVFDHAYGEPGRTLPLPGGHGQSFSVLKSTYQDMHAAGFRFAYIGNVDNLGYTMDPVSLAYFALSGRPAAFEFAYKTPVDVKGGILIEDTHRGLTCGDIGPAVSRSYVEQAEQAGTPILFNCATGLFDLEWLTRNLSRIEHELPLRVSDQDKDAGRYSQAEQVTWEVIGMIDNPLIFAVDKYRRFLAAKLLSESFMTNAVYLDHPEFPSDPDPSRDLKGTAEKLHTGLKGLLTDVYRLPDRD